MTTTQPEWHPPTEYPEMGEPVIIAYHPFNNPANPVRQQIAFCTGDAWRPLPDHPDARCWPPLRWRRLDYVTARCARIAQLERSIADERARMLSDEAVDRSKVAMAWLVNEDMDTEMRDAWLNDLARAAIAAAVGEG